MTMKYLLISLLSVSLLIGFHINAQELQIPLDTTIITEHTIEIAGKTINYTAEVGFQPVWDDSGKVIATVQYTYYKVKDKKVNKRPLLISFNGGPGSASVWMHIGYTGPVLVNVDKEGFPVQPYGITPNEDCILDVTDLLYVNPINTGYSRVIDKEINAAKIFFGVNQDINYLASWISTFVKRHNRWLSPKFLIGESYGTVRVSGLSLELENSQWMYLNGVILVSPTDLGIDRDGAITAANRLPYYAVTAWYYGLLDEDLQTLTIEELAQQVEKFTIEEYIPALQYGSSLDSARKKEIISSVARYSSLSQREVRNHNLIIPKSYYWKALKRKNGGFTVGRLDSRYLGIDRELAGVRPDYYAELSTWLHAFTPAINWYFSNVLQFKTDLRYNMFGNVYPWDRDHNRTGRQLRKALATNPFMHVLIQSGYYDGATTYYDAKYTARHLDLSGRLDGRIDFKVYKSGHMIYMRDTIRKRATDDLREFIKNALPTGPAKYR